MHNPQPRIVILATLDNVAYALRSYGYKKLLQPGAKMNKILLLAGAVLLLGLSACFTPDVNYSNTHPPYGDWTQR
jgi:hypothetical protein